MTLCWQLGNLNGSSNYMKYDAGLNTTFAAGKYYFFGSYDPTILGIKNSQKQKNFKFKIQFLLASFGPDGVWTPVIDATGCPTWARGDAIFLNNSRDLFFAGAFERAQQTGFQPSLTCTGHILALRENNNENYVPPPQPASGWSQYGYGVLGTGYSIATNPGGGMR